MKFIASVSCEYEVEADSRDDAFEIARRIALSLSRSGVTRHSGPRGHATLKGCSVASATSPKEGR